MSDPLHGAPGPHATDRASDNLRTMAIICYVLFLLAIINGLTAVIGVILAYLKKGDANGTIWHSHFENLIVVFWVVLIFSMVWFASLPVSFGVFWAHGFVWPWAPLLGLPLVLWLIACPLVILWYFYRLIRGLIRVSDDRAY
jgi:uncharacterized membrane protein